MSSLVYALINQVQTFKLLISIYRRVVYVSSLMMYINLLAIVLINALDPWSNMLLKYISKIIWPIIVYSKTLSTKPTLYHCWFRWRHLMNEMRGELGKKNPKKEIRIPHFYYVIGIKSVAYWASSTLATCLFLFCALLIVNDVILVLKLIH